MVIDYTIVERATARRLTEQAVEMVKAGWEPLGGVNVTCWDCWAWQHNISFEECFMYTQAFVKRAKIE